MAFTKEFNERTKKRRGVDHSSGHYRLPRPFFSFVTKTPPAAVLIKKACKIESGSATPNTAKVATNSKEESKRSPS
jgi:large subunit ribosomal protein L11